MNKTEIEWCDYSWNPVTGCNHGCPYCYARKIAERFRGSKAWPKGFEPTFHPSRLSDPRKMKNPQTIFVCSMADLFGYWVPGPWQNSIFTIAANSNHTYIFLTKNPLRMMQKVRGVFYQFGDNYYPSKVPRNLWFGTTITTIADYEERINYLKGVPTGNRFISFEPLFEDIGKMDLTGIRQVIIGAQTNPFYPVQVSWIKNIEEEADRVGAKVFVKDSLKQWMGDSPLFRRDLAWDVHK